MKKFILLSLVLLILGSASAAIVSRAQLENKTNTGKVTLNDYNTLTGAVDVLTDLFNGVAGEVNEISFPKSVKISEICLDGDCATAWPVDPNSPWNESGSDLSFMSGNVGIGVALPTEKLQVAGDLDLSGNLIKNGSPVIPACVDGQELIFSNDGLACGDPEIECDTDIDCDDSDDLTSDTCADAGTINAICLNEEIEVANGLIAKYDFDGNALDSSGFDNHGTVFGAEYVTDRHGNPSGAIRFPDERITLRGATISDPTETYVEIPSSATIDAITNPIEGSTFVAWIKMKGNTQHHLFKKMNGASGLEMNILNPFLTNCDKSSNTRLNTSVNGGSSAVDGYILDNIDTSPWRHLAIVTEGSNTTYYIDGQDVNRNNSHEALNIDTSGQPAYIGNKHDGVANETRVEVTLDDVQLYDMPLTATEVADLYGVDAPVCSTNADCGVDLPVCATVPHSSSQVTDRMQCVECYTDSDCSGGQMCAQWRGECTDLVWKKSSTVYPDLEGISSANESGTSMCIRLGYSGCDKVYGVPYTCDSHWIYTMSPERIAAVYGLTSQDWAFYEEMSCNESYYTGAAMCTGEPDFASPVVMWGNSNVDDFSYVYNHFETSPYYVAENPNSGDTACALGGHGACVVAYGMEGEEVDCSTDFPLAGVAVCEEGCADDSDCASRQHCLLGTGECVETVWRLDNSALYSGTGTSVREETGDAMCLRMGYAQCDSAFAIYDNDDIRPSTCSGTQIEGAAKCSGTPVGNIVIWAYSGLDDADAYATSPYYYETTNNWLPNICSGAGYGDCIRIYIPDGDEVPCDSTMAAISGVALCESLTCTPSTCIDLGLSCGVHDDGCGGTVDCGSCGECSSDEDCDDSNPSTEDSCLNPGKASSTCQNSIIADCSSDGDCDDSNPSTEDTCLNPGTASSSCQNVPVVCSSDAECNDFNPGTVDTCLNPGTASSVCQNSCIPTTCEALSATCSPGDSNCRVVYECLLDPSGCTDEPQEACGTRFDTCGGTIDCGSCDALVNWGYIHSGDAACAEAGYSNCTSAYSNSFGSTQSCSSQAGNDGYATCSTPIPITTTWGGLTEAKDSGDGACARDGYETCVRSFIDGEEVPCSTASGYEEYGRAICEAPVIAVTAQMDDTYSTGTNACLNEGGYSCVTAYENGNEIGCSVSVRFNNPYTTVAVCGDPVPPKVVIYPGPSTDGYIGGGGRSSVDQACAMANPFGTDCTNVHAVISTRDHYDELNSSSSYIGFKSLGGEVYGYNPSTETFTRIAGGWNNFATGSRLYAPLSTATGITSWWSGSTNSGDYENNVCDDGRDAGWVSYSYENFGAIGGGNIENYLYTGTARCNSTHNLLCACYYDLN